MHNLSETDANYEFARTVMAIKAARLLKSISRKEAVALLGWSPASLEQLENGRCNFSNKRLQKIITAYGYSAKEFERIRREPKLYLARVASCKKKGSNFDRKPRRNHLKIITKEVRAIRILRKRRKLSQYQAAALCGMAPAGFGHIEAGRIELTNERVSHILKCLEFTWREYEELIAAPVMRDDLIENMVKDLQQLDDHALSSAANIIKALIK